jgi:hypothetical protein
MVTYAELKDPYWQGVQGGDATMMTIAEYARTKIKKIYISCLVQVKGKQQQYL